MLTETMTNPIWQKNINGLQQFYPQIAKALHAAIIPEQQIKVERAKNGSSVLYVSHSGQIVPLNDMTNPAQSARDWVKQLGGGSIKNGHVMIVGVGTGYHPFELLCGSDSDTLIWIVEPEIQLLKAALHVFDFRPLIESKRVRWLVGLNSQQIIERLFDGIEANRMRAQGIQMAVYPPLSAFYQPYIKTLSYDLSQAIQFDVLKFKTEEIQGKALLKNAVDNLPNILQGYPLSSLQSAAPGVPAWIVAPGPSLENEIKWIKEYRNNALVIAVDTANRILHKHDIFADIIASIDFTELNVKHFDYCNPEQSILVSFVGVQKPITDIFKGNTYFFIHSANRFIQSIPSLKPLGQIEAVGSTAHVSYLLARWLSCSPIILIGNDLSFPNGQWYAAGAMQLEIDQPERQKEQLLDVESNSGTTVKTNALYKIYLDEMGKLIAKSGGNVINTSIYGARIGGTTVLPFQEAIQKYCQSEIDKSFLSTHKKKSLLSKKDQVIQDLQKLRHQCLLVKDQLLQFHNQAERLSVIPRKFQSGIKEIMSELQSTLQRDSIIFSLTIPLCTRSTINLFGNLGQAGFSAGDSSERSEQIKANLVQLFQDFINAIDYTVSEIERGTALLQTDKTQ